MRISDVKVGDVVIPQRFEGRYLLPGGCFIYWAEAEMQQFLGVKTKVVQVDADTSVRIKLPDGQSYWWPVQHCDRAAQVSTLEHVSDALALAARYQKQLETELADERRVITDLRKTVADLTQLTTSLESQVVTLRAELQKVGKQTQNGSRFALLELD